MVSAGSVIIALSSCHKDFNPKSYAPPLSINGFTSSGAIEKSALVGYYSFNGSLIDSVSHTSGTAHGTSFGKGEIGQGLQGGNGDYVIAAPSTAIKTLSSFTIDEWLNTSPPPSTGGIVGVFTLANTQTFWGNIDMFFENGSSNTNGIFKMHIANATADGFYVVNNLQNMFGKWVNIAITYDQTTGNCQMFVNGSMVNSGASGITGPLQWQNIGDLVFGCVQFQTNPSETSATGSQPWAGYNMGLTDEVRIYNKVLTSSEISALVALEGRGK